MTWILIAAAMVLLYVVGVLFVLAICSAAKRGRSDLPKAEPEPDAKAVGSHPRPAVGSRGSPNAREEGKSGAAERARQHAGTSVP